MKTSAKKHPWFPLIVFVFFIFLLLIMAFTDLFDQVIGFIHSKEITAYQAIACIVGALLGFFIVYKVLVKLGEFFLSDKS